VLPWFCNVHSLKSLNTSWKFSLLFWFLVDDMNIEVTLFEGQLITFMFHLRVSFMMPDIVCCVRFLSSVHFLPTMSALDYGGWSTENLMFIDANECNHWRRDWCEANVIFQPDHLPPNQLKLFTLVKVCPSKVGNATTMAQLTQAMQCWKIHPEADTHSKLEL